MSTDKRVEVSFDIAFGDLYKGTLAATAYALRYLIWSVLLVVGLYIGSLFLANVLHGPWTEFFASLGDWLYPVLIGSVPTAAILVPVVPYFRLKQMIRTQGVEGKRHYIFNDEGIWSESDLGTGSAKWEAYRQVRETRNYFLLFAAPGFAQIIPKKFFSSPSDVADFRAIIRARLPKSELLP